MHNRSALGHGQVFEERGGCGRIPSPSGIGQVSGVGFGLEGGADGPGHLGCRRSSGRGIVDGRIVLEHGVVVGGGRAVGNDIGAGTGGNDIGTGDIGAGGTGTGDIGTGDLCRGTFPRGRFDLVERVHVEQLGAAAVGSCPAHSHSMVPGGFDVTSSATRLTPSTSLMMRDDMRSTRSYGSRAQSAVMASSLVTARMTIG